MNLRHIFWLLAIIFFVSCGKDEDEVAPSSNSTSINVNANDASANRDLARWEVPHTNSSNLFIAHRTSDGMMNYCLEYNLTANHSQWVAYRYDTKLAANNTGSNRTNAWNWDPALNNEREHQATTQSFYPYQRGHLLGSAERYYSDEANEQTFYMSNMSPMIGNFNGNDWGNGIEALIRYWGRCTTAGDTLYVVKGGTTTQTIGTLTTTNTAGHQMQIVVPKYYFAACLDRLASGNIYAIGFWIEHKDYQLSGSSAQIKQKATELARSCAVSIDELERLTGIDFFCNLPDTFEDRVEAKLDLSHWTWDWK